MDVPLNPQHPVCEPVGCNINRYSMNQKVVTQLPLKELTVDGLNYKRGRNLLVSDIKEALRLGNAEFIIVDIGKPLERIASSSVYDFWKEEKENIADDERIYLEDYPGEYFYSATEWTSNDNDKRIILLEKNH